MPAIETTGLPIFRQANSQTRRLIAVDVWIVAEEGQESSLATLSATSISAASGSLQTLCLI
jgi:hypothetical protein